MEEECVNVFAYGDKKFVRSIGYRSYLAEGSYEDLIRLLRSRVDSDYKHVARTVLDSSIPWREFNSRCRIGWLNELVGGPSIIPEVGVYCITPVVNGAVKVDEVVDFLGQPTFPDYLSVYRTDSGLDIPRLINDDYFVAVKLLMNDGKYVSALKLILSMIDTLGYIEFGPINGCFVKWLDEYCEMNEFGVTSEEIWELRNSLLHMSNLDSRKVQKGTVKRLLPAFASPEVDIPANEEGLKIFHVYRFVLKVLPEGIRNWIQSYNTDRSKFVDFVSRYDTIVSEARMAEQRSTM